MTNPAHGAPEKIQRTVEAAVAPPRARRRRAARFEFVLLAASAAFVALAFAAHHSPYFQIDLAITRALQSYHGSAFAGLMRAVSWPGYWPQALLPGTVAVGLLFLVGLRWEAVSAVFSTGGLILGLVVKLLVYRPRPSEELVHVARRLSSYSFPSGHVIETTAFCGFLAFLAFTLLKPSAWRTGLVGALCVPVALMGMSRVFLGEHWFSDVVGGYVLGGLWLVLTLRVYRWGKPRFFAQQPVAPAEPGS
jgi:undecaprenyl-diphosphatase